MLKKIAITICSTLLGACGGSAVGWLIGRTIYFFIAELPNRNLPADQFAIVAFDKGFGVGLLTFSLFIPIGIAVGAGTGLWIGMRESDYEADSEIDKPNEVIGKC